MPGPSVRKGMGAQLHDGGSTFRVWAPNATAVSVTVWRNDAEFAKEALVRDGGQGRDAVHWSAFVPNVRDGDEYRYSIKSSNGATVSRMDPRCRTASSSVGNSIVCKTDFDWTGDNFRTPPWDDLVIYEMHIGTYNDTPAVGPGTFADAIKRLDHLSELGVNAIQIMPAFEFDNDRSVGYNPALPFALESAYGTPNVVQKLVKAAHQRGIAVLFDVVYNHFGPAGLDQCLRQFDGWTNNNGGGIYFYEDDRKFTPWGERPDFGRPEVRDFVRDNVLLLLDEYRGDGVRWDSTGCVRMNRGFCEGHCCGEGLADGWGLMRWVNDEVKWRSPGKLTIAEDLNGNGDITRPTPQGGAGFGAQWDSDFLWPVRRAVLAPGDGGRDMGEVTRALYHRFGESPWDRVIYVESHNEASNGRLPDLIQPGNATGWFAKKRATLAAGVLMTAPGIPMIFQGEELMEWQSWNETRAMDWNKKDQNRGIFTMFRDLIRLRRNWFNNTRGLRGPNVNVFHVNNADKVIAYHRWNAGGPGDDVVVVANFGDRNYGAYNVGFPRGGLWYNRFNSDYRGYDAGFGGVHAYDTSANYGPRDGLTFSANVGVGAYSVVIFSQ